MEALTYLLTNQPTDRPTNHSTDRPFNLFVDLEDSWSFFLHFVVFRVSMTRSIRLLASDYDYDYIYDDAVYPFSAFIKSYCKGTCLRIETHIQI